MTVEIIASSGGRIRRLHYRCTVRHEASRINSGAFDHAKMTVAFELREYPFLSGVTSEKCPLHIPRRSALAITALLVQL